MQRVSKRYVVVTSVTLGLGSLFSLAGLVVSLRRDLDRAHAALERLEAQTRTQETELDKLDDRLGGLGKELLDARRLEAKARQRLLEELEARKQSEGAAIRGELEGLELRVRQLRDAAEEHARLLAEARRNEDVETRYRELMSPTVRINGKSEVGSGSVLWSRRTPGEERCRTFVLTAWHVVQADADAPSRMPGPLEVDFYEDGELAVTERGRVVAWDSRLDLALVEVDCAAPHGFLARLPAREALAGMKPFSPVYAIGCPLGYPPLPTSGELTTLHKELDGIVYYMINAPTIFGNSGGGIYLAQGNQLIGVLARISAYKNMIDVAVPHMGLVLPMGQVYDWLDGTRYAFVYRDRLEEGAALPAAGGEAVAPLPASSKTEDAALPR